MLQISGVRDSVRAGWWRERELVREVEGEKYGDWRQMWQGLNLGICCRYSIHFS
jgi:hypothetical protein